MLGRQQADSEFPKPYAVWPLSSIRQLGGTSNLSASRFQNNLARSSASIDVGANLRKEGLSAEIQPCIFSHFGHSLLSVFPNVYSDIFSIVEARHCNLAAFTIYPSCAYRITSFTVLIHNHHAYA